MAVSLDCHDLAEPVVFADTAAEAFCTCGASFVATTCDRAARLWREHRTEMQVTA